MASISGASSCIAQQREDSTEGNGFKRILIKFYGMVLAILTLGFQSRYAARFSYTTSVDWSHVQRGQHYQFFETLAGYRQWEDVLDHMKPIWKATRTACALLLSLSIALLQINGLIDDPLARYFLILSCIFSGGGLTVSSIYVAMESKLANIKVRDKWISASRNPGSIASMDFWACLATPVSSVIWQVVSNIRSSDDGRNHLEAPELRCR
ncbi:hypothetical protein CVT26_015971 [Gymnopilus dilepis]|uniref:Autophagy-related protein n=1 Tax=Gymnopilus dilepis TaxID=231916 RepID=A0A409XYP4_9AGAR|nr:hypothetical protein CVT26_015971 [Gymnopilus dilepis]